MASQIERARNGEASQEVAQPSRGLAIATDSIQRRAREGITATTVSTNRKRQDSRIGDDPRTLDATSISTISDLAGVTLLTQCVC